MGWTVEGFSDLVSLPFKACPGRLNLSLLPDSTQILSVHKARGRRTDNLPHLLKEMCVLVHCR